jgi:hypothetical protein
MRSCALRITDSNPEENAAARFAKRVRHRLIHPSCMRNAREFFAREVANIANFFAVWTERASGDTAAKDRADVCITQPCRIAQQRTLSTPIIVAVRIFLSPHAGPSSHTQAIKEKTDDKTKNFCGPAVRGR